MRLTVKIKQAADSHMDLQVAELPILEVFVSRVAEIPDVVSDAAAALTGRSKEDFEVEVAY